MEIEENQPVTAEEISRALYENVKFKNIDIRKTAIESANRQWGNLIEVLERMNFKIVRD